VRSGVQWSSESGDLGTGDEDKCGVVGVVDMVDVEDVP
jgi:hypothetical protein